MMLHHLVASVRTSLDALDAEIAKGGPLVDLGLALDELRQARRELGEVHDRIEDAVVAGLGQRWSATIGGLGGLKVHGGKQRRAWRHDDLWEQALKRSRSVDPLTIHGQAETEAETAIRIARDAIQPAYWRAGVLKGWGVQPDDYCQVSWGRKTVEITR